jgi:hypothetical protein
MTSTTQARRFVVCVRNARYDASLDVRKIYEAFPDASAEAHDLIRVVDESGEDYLYPSRFFVPIDWLPRSRKRSMPWTTDSESGRSSGCPSGITKVILGV